MSSQENQLVEFFERYALERQWIDIQVESLPFERQERQWWDWYYWAQFDWRSITKSERRPDQEQAVKPKKK